MAQVRRWQSKTENVNDGGPINERTLQQWKMPGHMVLIPMEYEPNQLKIFI